MSQKYLCYTLAEPTQDPFPVDTLRSVLEKSLYRVLKLDLNYFKSRKEWLEKERATSARMCIEGYESILATFNRDQLRFGDATVVDLEGETADGYTLKVTIGEKAIVVRFTQPRPAENSAEAGEIISRMKELITQTSPHVRFDDHWVEPKEK